MARYEEKIERALKYLKDPSRISPTGCSPIAYLVYQPEEVMVFKNAVETVLNPKADYYGFNVHYLSIGELINKFINNNENLIYWTDESLSEEEVYNGIKQELEDSEYLTKQILSFQENFKDEKQPLIIIKDVEMLHPFYMMGVIENKIYNQIQVPILVLYPGEEQGTARSFLGLYNQDGNYRSSNF